MTDYIEYYISNIGFVEYNETIEILNEIISSKDICKLIVEMNSYCGGCSHKWCRIKKS